jgi:hypothetical protein
LVRSVSVDDVEAAHAPPRWSAGRLLTSRHHQGLLISGQIIGSRPDMVPDPYVDVLSRLQDQVPPRGFRTVKRAVERELQRPLEDVFEEFATQPIASASLAQVHRAILKDGRVVAVKVQYPWIQDIVANDLANIRFLLRILNRFERSLDFSPLIEELSHNVPLELTSSTRATTPRRSGVASRTARTSRSRASTGSSRHAASW